uniref:Uncharacterized protein n=1 Tax=Arundo donax TaxID=35708 RepID=A0A0A9B6S0_ARUDO
MKLACGLPRNSRKLKFCMKREHSNRCQLRIHHMSYKKCPLYL